MYRPQMGLFTICVCMQSTDSGVIDPASLLSSRALAYGRSLASDANISHQRVRLHIRISWWGRGRGYSATLVICFRISPLSFQDLLSTFTSTTKTECHQRQRPAYSDTLSSISMLSLNMQRSFGARDVLVMFHRNLWLAVTTGPLF